MDTGKNDNLLPTRKWKPDADAMTCMQCNDEFTFLIRKHHCRACGEIFCHQCTLVKLLIPEEMIAIPIPNVIINPKIPQRVCSQCSSKFDRDEIQSSLRLCVSAANRQNEVNRDDPDRYMNSPVSFKLEDEIKKATFTLWNFTKDNKYNGHDSIPRSILGRAKGIVFITLAKAGVMLTAKLGTGIVVARLADGNFSAPSAISLTGVGWGLQIGGELLDVIIVLMSDFAVNCFASETQVSLGSQLSVSAGPVGRGVDVNLQSTEQGSYSAFSYAHSKGLFLGFSLEASIIYSRSEINRNFYGMQIKPDVLLSGSFPRPKAAEPLYKALTEVLSLKCNHDNITRTRTLEEEVEEEVTFVNGGNKSNASSSASLDLYQYQVENAQTIRKKGTVADSEMHSELLRDTEAEVRVEVELQHIQFADAKTLHHHEIDSREDEDNESDDDVDVDGDGDIDGNAFYDYRNISAALSLSSSSSVSSSSTSNYEEIRF